MKKLLTSTVLAAALAVAGSSAFADENYIPSGPSPYCKKMNLENCFWTMVLEEQSLDTSLFGGNVSRFLNANQYENVDDRTLLRANEEYYFRNTTGS